MTTDAEKLVDAALKLSVLDRLAIVEDLQASMHLVFWAENEQAWREEIESRTSALKTGEAGLTPSEDVAARLRQKGKA
jgi:putative addiction module component (TIGR02574 family)